MIEKDIIFNFLHYFYVTNQMRVLDHVTRSLKQKKDPRNTETFANSFF